MYIMFGIGILLVVGGFSLIKGGDSDGRFRTGHKGNVTPDLPGGYFALFFALNFILIGWGFIFLKEYASISEIIQYVKITGWKQMNLFIYFTCIVFFINGFMIPIASLFMPSD